MKELWDKVWPLLAVLVGAAGGLLILTLVAHNNPEYAKSFKMAVKGAKAILGVAGIVAGFLGLSTAAKKDLKAEHRISSASGGMVGVLGGATLLGVGEWYIPAALALTSTGIAAALVRKLW